MQLHNNRATVEESWRARWLSQLRYDPAFNLKMQRVDQINQVDFQYDVTREENKNCIDQSQNSKPKRKRNLFLSFLQQRTHLTSIQYSHIAAQKGHPGWDLQLRPTKISKAYRE